MEVSLGSAPLFAALDSESAAAMRASMQEFRFARGEAVFLEGDPGDRLYLVSTGKVKLSHAASDGRETMLAVMGPGDMFGELSLFDPGPRTASAKALTDTTLLSMDRSSLRAWLTGRPEVAEALLQGLAQRLRRTNVSLSDLVFSDVPGRVAKALIDLGEKFGEGRADGLFVEHDLTQEEIAQLVGASRETVNKALADFVSRGWIRLESRSVTITDLDRLEKRAR